MSALAPTLQSFFTDRLVRQRQASRHTLAAYRDTMRLLLRFAAERRSIEPVRLEISDLDASLISAFLDHREHQCGNSIRTRNARLIAIRSLFRYAALRHSEHAAVIQRVLAIPPKRFERRLVSFLTDPEVEVVYNPLANALHGPWNLAAVTVAKHVLTEKPSASNAEEAREVRDVAARYITP